MKGTWRRGRKVVVKQLGNVLLVSTFSSPEVMSLGYSCGLNANFVWSSRTVPSCLLVCWSPFIFGLLDDLW